MTDTVRFRTILIADDSQMARAFLRRCFETSGIKDCTYIEASDGAAALPLLRNGGVDLVVADLNMPVMGGDRLLESIRSSPRLARIPVMIVSSLAGPQRCMQLLEQGAQAVLFKPVAVQDLEEALVSVTRFVAGTTS